MPGTQELLIILAIVFILFGAKKIPELATGIGKGIKNFKSAVKDEDKIEEKAEATKVEKNEEKQEA